MLYNFKNNPVVLLHLYSKSVLGMNYIQLHTNDITLHPPCPSNFSTMEADSSTHNCKWVQAKQGHLSLHIRKSHKAAEVHVDTMQKWGNQCGRATLGRWESTDKHPSITIL